MSYSQTAKPTRANLRTRMQAARESTREAMHMAHQRNEFAGSMELARAADMLARAAQLLDFKLDDASRGGIK